MAREIIDCSRKSTAVAFLNTHAGKLPSKYLYVYIYVAVLFSALVRNLLQWTTVNAKTHS